MIFTVVDYDTTESKSEQGTLLRLYALFYTICKYDSYTEHGAQCTDRQRYRYTYLRIFHSAVVIYIFLFYFSCVCVLFFFLRSVLFFFSSAFGILLSSTVSNTVYLHAHSKSIPFYCERFAQIAHDHLSMFELIGCKTHFKLCLSTEYGRAQCLCVCVFVSLCVHFRVCMQNAKLNIVSFMDFYYTVLPVHTLEFRSLHSHRHSIYVVQLNIISSPCFILYCAVCSFLRIDCDYKF